MEPSGSSQPLYRQVYDYVVGNIVRGTWRAGEILPNEQVIARELNVSIGTVRKALDMLASENLVQRRQGKGTFVAETTPESSLFRFFRFTDARGHRAAPTSSGDTIRKRETHQEEAAALRLVPSELVFEINRDRLLNGKVIALERIVIPVKLFPHMDTHLPLPNALYAVYEQEYGIHIVRADERLSAVPASKQDARRLRLEPGMPLLNVERIAISMRGDPVELRTKRCDTREFYYAVSLS